jgi:hypothetical protein
MTEQHRHGSAYDRGSADAYYGRPFQPHFFTGDTNRSTKITAEFMTAQELADYERGYKQETDRKDWGRYDEQIEVEYDSVRED